MPAPGIVVVGDLVTDVLVRLAGALEAGTDTAARITFTGGGQGANTAAWLAAEGVATWLVGVVGDDEPGRAAVAELTARGVRCLVRVDPAAPTGTVVVLTGDGDRTMINDRGANLRLRPADIDAALDAAPHATHLHLSGYPLLDPATRPAGRHALAAARARGWTTSVDAASAAPLRAAGPAAFRDWITGTDLLLANRDEARVLAVGAPGSAPPGGPHPATAPTPTALTSAAGSGPTGPAYAEAARLADALAGTAAHVIVKLGAQGAVWRDAERRHHAVSAVPTTATDPTGAGDAFAAGLLAAWLAGADPGAGLEAGVAHGGQAVTTLGARRPPRA